MRKSGDAVGRPSRRSSLRGDPGEKFLGGKLKSSLNSVSACLKVVDTRRSQKGVPFGPGPNSSWRLAPGTVLCCQDESKKRSESMKKARSPIVVSGQKQKTGSSVFVELGIIS